MAETPRTADDGLVLGRPGVAQKVRPQRPIRAGPVPHVDVALVVDLAAPGRSKRKQTTISLCVCVCVCPASSGTVFLFVTVGGWPKSTANDRKDSTSRGHPI